MQTVVAGVKVTRRMDTDMVNGTKLINVTRMTRGRRDCILRHERVKQIVTRGPVHFKGVWLPLERSVAIARMLQIYGPLKPLFDAKMAPEQSLASSAGRAGSGAFAQEQFGTSAQDFTETMIRFPTESQIQQQPVMDDFADSRFFEPTPTRRPQSMPTIEASRQSSAAYQPQQPYASLDFTDTQLFIPESMHIASFPTSQVYDLPQQQQHFPPQQQQPQQSQQFAHEPIIQQNPVYGTASYFPAATAAITEAATTAKTATNSELLPPLIDVYYSSNDGVRGNTNHLYSDLGFDCIQVKETGKSNSAGITSEQTNTATQDLHSTNECEAEVEFLAPEYPITTQYQYPSAG